MIFKGIEVAPGDLGGRISSLVFDVSEPRIPFGGFRLLNRRRQIRRGIFPLGIQLFRNFIRRGGRVAKRSPAAEQVGCDQFFDQKNQVATLLELIRRASIRHDRRQRVYFTGFGVGLAQQNGRKIAPGMRCKDRLDPWPDKVVRLVRLPGTVGHDVPARRVQADLSGHLDVEVRKAIRVVFERKLAGDGDRFAAKFADRFSQRLGGPFVLVPRIGGKVSAREQAVRRELGFREFQISVAERDLLDDGILDLPGF